MPKGRQQHAITAGAHADHSATPTQACAALKVGNPVAFSSYDQACSDLVMAGAARVIDASCIEALADGDGNVSVPVSVKNAVIVGELSFKHVTFKRDFSVVNSRFLQRPDFSFATFHRSAVFDHTLFCDGADFRAAHALHDFRLCYVRFEGKADFMDFHAEEVFRAEGAQFHTATFEEARFAKRALFCPRSHAAGQEGPVRRVSFRGHANFSGFHVGGPAHFEGVLFDAGADFRRARFDSSARFESYSGEEPGGAGAFVRTCFGGGVTFNGARVEGTAYFRGARFRGAADFERFSVGGHALFQPAWRKDSPAASPPVCFERRANFLAASVGGNAEFDAARFERAAVFERMKVGRNLFCRSFNYGGHRLTAEFRGTANFLGCQVEGDAEFRGTHFSGTQQPTAGSAPDYKADFEGFRVGGTAFFNDRLYGEDVGNVRFRVRVEFMNAQVANQARFERAVFGKGVDFTNLCVGGTANFGAARFHGETKFDSSDFKTEAKFRGAKFAGPRASFRAARFRILDLSGAGYRNRRFVNVLLPRSKWPGFPRRRDRSAPFYKARLWHWKTYSGNFDMSGATYDLIYTDLQRLLRSLDPYDRQSYTLLEKSYRAIGWDRDADLISYDGYCRDGQLLWEKVVKKGEKILPPHRWEYGSLPRALFNAAQRKVFRYGIRPYRLLLFSLAILVLGFFVFWQQGSIVQKEFSRRKPGVQHQTTFGEAVNMSLRQFIPVIEIPPGADWVPSDNVLPYAGATNFSYAGYAAVHRVCGFVLIPVGVAALAGLLQRRSRPGK
jgi:uncharacterized protein YjbI with pentapeptide repeats